MTLIEQDLKQEEGEKKKFHLFGRKVSEVPCFRDSFMNGILTGLGFGFGHFVFTSKVKKSCDVGMAMFGVVTLSYWFYCRYHWSKRKFEGEKLKKFIEDYNKGKGLEKDDI